MAIKEKHSVANFNLAGLDMRALVGGNETGFAYHYRHAKVKFRNRKSLACAYNPTSDGIAISGDSCPQYLVKPLLRAAKLRLHVWSVLLTYQWRSFDLMATGAQRSIDNGPYLVHLSRG